jgi:hypothetical protein
MQNSEQSDDLEIGLSGEFLGEIYPGKTNLNPALIRGFEEYLNTITSYSLERAKKVKLIYV